MKLVDLEATGQYDHPLLIRFSSETFGRLAPYRNSREASGFIRLAVEVLLAVGGDARDDGAENAIYELERVADELVTNCATTIDLWTLIANLHALGRSLERRPDQIETSSPQESLS